MILVKDLHVLFQLKRVLGYMHTIAITDSLPHSYRQSFEKIKSHHNLCSVSLNKTNHC